MSKYLNLPQVKAILSDDLPDKQVVLVSGGTAPDKTWLSKVCEDRPLWCADHGVDACMQADCKPYQLVGDGDSATQEGWNWALDNGSLITKVPVKKDVTDTQLALQMIQAEYKQATVILTGAWGGRFDHAFSTVFSVQGMAKNHLWGCIADEREVMFFLRDEDHITLRFDKQPKAISLLPLSGKCSGVSINGVYWPLDQVMLNNNLPYAISNEVNSKENTIWVSQKQGLLGIYLYWEKPVDLTEPNQAD